MLLSSDEFIEILEGDLAAVFLVELFTHLPDFIKLFKLVDDRRSKVDDEIRLLMLPLLVLKEPPDNGYAS